MNKIAQLGSELGNFMYIDTSKPNYSEDVGHALAESLDIAMEGGGAKLHLGDGLKLDLNLNLETNYIFADEEVDGMPVITGISLTCQTIMKTKDVHGLAATLNIKDNSKKLSVDSIRVDDPAEDVRLKARLEHANKKIFDLI